jgi:hypothetical protein
MNEQQRAVVRQAIEALCLTYKTVPTKYLDLGVMDEAITALRQLLEQPEEDCPHGADSACKECHEAAQPAAWVDLTDEDIAEVGGVNVEGPRMLPYAFARAIEAKLREKNGGCSMNQQQRAVAQLKEASGLALEVLQKHLQMKGDAPMGALGHRAIEELERARDAFFALEQPELVQEPAARETHGIPQRTQRGTP